MRDPIKYIILLVLLAGTHAAFAQSPTNPNYPGGIPTRPNLRDTSRTAPKLTSDQELDSLRRKQDKKRDTVIFNSKYIRVTSERFLRDSTQLFPLDTGIYNFENYSPLNQPRSPKISLGNLGLSERSLLFEPSRAIGFDAGLHALDAYVLNPQDINYYQAHVPYTQLSLFVGGVKEQYFKVLHTQNITPQLNVGFNLNFTGSRGFYATNSLGQKVSDVNAAAFSWYQSKNKRYNLLANLIYNNLKAPETGSIQDDSIFVTGSLDKTTQPVRLPNTYEQW